MLILQVLQGPDKGRRFELPDDEPQLIGRSSEALPLTDTAISRRHAELTPDGEGRWYINDLESANGTFVNGTEVAGRRRLQPGDQIRTGRTLMAYAREPAQLHLNHGVRVARKGEIESSVQHTIAANDDSMILAVREPGEGAALQLKVIYELTQLIGTIVDRDELLEKIMDLIFEYFRADRGFVLLQESPNSRPDPVVVRHRVEPAQKEDKQIAVSRTIVQHVLRRGEGVLSSNATTDERFARSDSVRDLGIRSALCVPIKYKDQLFGVIHIDSKLANYTYTEDQLHLLTTIGVQTGLALANVQMYSQRLGQERLAAVGQTVAALSHAVRNIIQGLRGGAEVVELGMRKENMTLVRNGWAIVSRNLERISTVTMNMLAFSKQRKPEVEMTNIDRLLEEDIELIQAQFDNKEAALLTDIDSNMPPVPIDPRGVDQAILNLLNNALDAVEPKTGAVSLRCDYDDKQQQVVIRVTDNGPGIPEDSLDEIFKPFYSTKGMKGTGLGLAVTRKIIEEHGGTIDVQSAPGKGTTFTIRLPIEPAEPASAETHDPL